MDNFEYNFVLLQETRLSKNLSALNIASDLCLAERQIISLEANSTQYFPSKSLAFTSLKKYILALGLRCEDVIFDYQAIDTIPSLLKAKE